VLEKVEFLY